MLTKMSKITDLISKLDGYTQGDDAERVRRCNPEKSTTRIGICIRICTWACMVVPFLRVPLSQPMLTQLRTIKALEAKLDASQVAYDAFVEAKTRLGDVERTNETPGCIGPVALEGYMG